MTACGRGPGLPSPTPIPADPTPPRGKLFGVSVAGAEFAERRLPGTLGRDYIYQTSPESYRYFRSKGLTIVRLPFRWERLQPTPFAQLSRPDIAGMRAALDAAHQAGQRVLLDMHNYGHYYGYPLRPEDGEKLADGWRRIVLELRGHPAIWGYEIMNEPHGLSNRPKDFDIDCERGSPTWARLAQQATDAIRSADQNRWILVPGYWYQTASHWPRCNQPLNVHDPAGRLLYAAHQYFDDDLSGAYQKDYDTVGAHPMIGVERLKPFQDWLEERDAMGIITEYGVPDTDPRWLAVADQFLAAVSAGKRLHGAMYWAAGPWWAEYPLSLEPRGGRDRPQMSVVAKYPSRTGALSESAAESTTARMVTGK
ncbi:MAG: glycoside hydrolase family 5 protein [Chloroflexota bacterium]